MSRHITTLDLHLEPADAQRLASLCGPFDDNIKQIERRLGVEIIYRNHHFQIVGKTVQAEAVMGGDVAALAPVCEAAGLPFDAERARTALARGSAPGSMS